MMMVVMEVAVSLVVVPVFGNSGGNASYSSIVSRGQEGLLSLELLRRNVSILARDIANIGDSLHSNQRIH